MSLYGLLLLSASNVVAADGNGPAPSPAPVPLAASQLSFFGPNGTSHLLSNTHITGVSTNKGSGKRAAIGFKSRGARIDALRTFHKWRPGSAGGPNDYHRGDGGVVRYTIQGDAGGRPDGTVLAQTPPIVGAPGMFASQSAAAARYPGAIWTQYGESGTRLQFRRIDLSSPLTTSPGTKLWMVVENVAGPGYKSPDYSHSVSLNAERNRHQWLRSMMDPDFDPHELRVLVQRDDDSWFDKSASASHGLVGVLEVIGDANYGYSAYGTPSASHTGDSSRGFRLDGTRAVRQTWKPKQNRTLKQFGLAAGLVSGTGAINLHIKQGGSTLYATTISGFPVISGQDVVTLHNELGVEIIALPDVQVVAGQEVYFKLTTDPKSHYIVGGGKDGTQIGYFDSGGFPEGSAQPFDGNKWITSHPWLEVSCNWLAV